MKCEDIPPTSASLITSGPGKELRELIAQAASDPTSLISAFTKKLGAMKIASLLLMAKPLLENRKELTEKVTETLGCGCSSKAGEMNTWGPDGCTKNMATILGWLRDACAERGLPWDEDAARAAVEMAIEKARSEPDGE